MGKKYDRRYIKRFRDLDIHEFDLKHEVWLYDDQWHQPVLDYLHTCVTANHSHNNYIKGVKDEIHF